MIRKPDLYEAHNPLILGSLSMPLVSFAINIHIGENLMATLDQIIAKVAAQTTQIDSLNTFTEGLAQQIKDLKLNQADQAKIDALFAAVEKNDQRLADAMTENTPGGGEPVIDPVEPV